MGVEHGYLQIVILENGNVVRHGERVEFDRHDPRWAANVDDLYVLRIAARISYGRVARHSPGLLAEARVANVGRARAVVECATRLRLSTTLHALSRSRIASISATVAIATGTTGLSAKAAGAVTPASSKANVPAIATGL